jgi:hypothetical protein
MRRNTFDIAMIKQLMKYEMKLIISSTPLLINIDESMIIPEVSQ